MAEKKRKTELDIEGITPQKAPEPPPPPAHEEPPPPPQIDEPVEEEKPKSKPNKKTLVMAAVVGGILLALVATFLIVRNGKKNSATETQKVEKKSVEKKVEKPKEPSAPAVPKPVNLPMEPFTLSYKDGGGDKFIRLAFTVQLNGEEGLAEAKENMALIRRGILFYLNSRSKKDLFSENLRGEILKDIKYNMDKSLQTGKVQAVYISEFMVY
ncbi:MAG: flagellar basal body-associated FliL family protein [Nitrospinae bacterium]|nr:flagellar basal body-associated FliL family protein [Nitrospinota bacterium]